MEQSATPTNSGAVTVLAPASTQLATAVSSGTAATTGGKRSGADRNKQSSAQQLVDDPNQYHAKPRELAEIAAKRPRDNTSSSINSNSSSGGSKAIFSQTPFSSLGLDPRLLAVLEGPTLQGGLGLRTATMVQTATISALLEQRRNVLMKSQTGSGKTLAYLLPLINDLITMDPPLTRADGTRALILAPTRELCSQIGEVLQKLTTAYVRIVGGSITGGEKRKSEKARLRKGVVVLVATPGRLLDHLKATEAFSLQNLRWVVLDEADRLLDMGKTLCYCFVTTDMRLTVRPQRFASK